MSSPEAVCGAATPVYGQPLSAKDRRIKLLPEWVLEYDKRPFRHGPSGLWLYGNLKLLDANLAYVGAAFGPNYHTSSELASIELEAKRHVLRSRVLVCGIHNRAHRRTAMVPLRWGSPRIVVMSGGFLYHLGEGFFEEPFRAARLWRRCWDPLCDLAISRRAPEKLPTYACHNSTVDRLIAKIVNDGLKCLERRPTSPIGPVA